MAETDAKRTKISELLEYIESRLTELEEEKEELKEYQDKDKERRCLEYALYQRELEEVGEAMTQIENERRRELHDANNRRETFNEREKQTQVGAPYLLRSCYLTTNRTSKERHPKSNTPSKPSLPSGRTLSQNSQTSLASKPKSLVSLMISRQQIPALVVAKMK